MSGRRIPVVNDTEYAARELTPGAHVLVGARAVEKPRADQRFQQPVARVWIDVPQALHLGARQVQAGDPQVPASYEQRQVPVREHGGLRSLRWRGDTGILGVSKLRRHQASLLVWTKRFIP